VHTSVSVASSPSLHGVASATWAGAPQTPSTATLSVHSSPVSVQVAAVHAQTRPVPSASQRASVMPRAVQFSLVSAVLPPSAPSEPARQVASVP